MTNEKDTTTTKAVKEAYWLINHIMGKKKRIDWGKSFDIDFGHLNDAMIAIEQAAHQCMTAEERKTAKEQ